MLRGEREFLVGVLQAVHHAELIVGVEFAAECVHSADDGIAHSFQVSGTVSPLTMSSRNIRETARVLRNSTAVASSGTFLPSGLFSG